MLTKFFPISAGFIALAFTLMGNVPSVFIESRESKTKAGTPVYNRIALETQGPRDIWLMQQSHAGPHAGESQSDRLAIVVDKSGPKPVASFYQLEPGPLKWSDTVQRRPLKVACYLCHANGPRAIRPLEVSAFAPLSVGEKLKIAYWNLKIKSYGQVETDPSHVGGTPVRYPGASANETLKIASCTRCHRSEGPFARGALTKQNFMAIRFMVEQGEMPPLGLSVSDEDRKELRLFIGE